MSFFRFPADPERRKLWENFIRHQDWKAKDHTRVCSRHFISGKLVAAHCVGGLIRRVLGLFTTLTIM